ncbi:hypothetical protein P3J6_120392 [Pseudoalteromonas sp. 3J6]|nr:hypothetical protein P3J6_120392 [Pseudoalteromonas sp. 3J6]
MKLSGIHIFPQQDMRTPLAWISTFFSDLSSRDTLDWPKCGLVTITLMTRQ